MASNHWATGDDRNFFPRGDEKEFPELPCGIYDIKNSIQGSYFRLRKSQDLSELIRFGDTQVDEAVSEIKSFWTKKSLFNKHNFAFRRGILLYGPPGSGKSCAIKMIIDDVVKMNGIAVMFTDPSLFTSSMEFLREIQTTTPIVVVIEDIDSWLNSYESVITDILDGHGGYEDVVFLATTNNINSISDRIKNRPSRFDKRIYVGPPNLETRREYIANLIGKSDDFKHIEIDVWAKDSENLTFAHLKELFLSVCFFDCDYKSTLDRMMDMTKYESEYNMDSPSSLQALSLQALAINKKISRATKKVKGRYKPYESPNDRISYEKDDSDPFADDVDESIQSVDDDLVSSSSSTKTQEW